MGLKRGFYEGSWLFRQVEKPGDGASDIPILSALKIA